VSVCPEEYSHIRVRVGLAPACGLSGRSDQPPLAEEPAGDPGATRRDGELHHTQARSGDGRGWRKRAQRRGWAAMGLGQLCPRISVDDRGRWGAAHTRHGQGGCGGHQGTCRGPPAFFSDGFTCYLAVLIAAFHIVTTFARTGKRGRPRKPICAPHPALLYGQLVKQKKQGTLLTLSTHVVLGAERLTHLGLTISTALVERLHLTLRKPWRRWCARRTASAKIVSACSSGGSFSRPSPMWPDRT
jgi:hypothetical protein